MLLSVVKLSERLDWGFGNSNTTGAFIAILLVALWAVPAVVPSPKRKGPTLLLVLREILWFGALGVTLYLCYKELQTGSRGGAVAALTGIATVAVLSARKWKSWKWWRVAASVLAVVGVVFLAARVHPAERLAPGYSVGDASIGNRLKIWKWTPAMIADAPDGWGWKQSPKAFMDWYQDPDHRETYTALVNTHLEWLVEFNWLARIAYLLGWALVLRLLWPVNCGKREDENSFQRFSAVALGTWVALAVGAFFSTVANEWTFWPVPVFLLLVVAGTRWRRKCWPTWRNLLFSVLVPAVAVMLALLATGWITSPMSVRERGARVKIGSGTAQIVLFVGATPSETPRQLRTVWRETPGAPTVYWVATGRADDVKGKIKTLVLLGEVAPEAAKDLVSRAERVLVFGLRFAPESVFDENSLAKVRTYVGEFSNSSHLDAWRATGRCVNVEGDGDFVESWVTRSFEN